ncbi:hypothetical protein ACFL6M_01360 [Candidatus Eisenbacteria bacterium]|uniref:FlgD Ig-like domain-containing protein n=1 Tax=Eiseniibacteriota bacterium TaxID=2212470 RepID=A0ABV6YIQ8_UNCEI
MKQNARLLGRILLLIGIGLPTLMPTANGDWMGEFLPLHLGANWTYENRDIPGDTYTEVVFESIFYEGHFAFRFGIDPDDHTIIFNDGQTVTVYAEVDGGQLFDFEEDIVLGEFEDGHTFTTCAEAPCDTQLVRVWESMDPVLRGIYQIDPAPGDLLLFASYDRDYGPNLHNVIVEANIPGGVVIPAGAITNLEWFWRDVGSYGQMNIDAESGGIEDTYFLLEHEVSVEDPQDDRPWATLRQNTPNPFYGETTIRCQVSMSNGTVGSGVFPVRLRIHDSTGRSLRCLEPSQATAVGWLSYQWDGRDDGGRLVASGTYFYRLDVDAIGRSQCMLFLRR